MKPRKTRKKASNSVLKSQNDKVAIPPRIAVITQIINGVRFTHKI